MLSYKDKQALKVKLKQAIHEAKTTLEALDMSNGQALIAERVKWRLMDITELFVAMVESVHVADGGTLPPDEGH